MVRYITEIPSSDSGGILNNGRCHNCMDLFWFVSGNIHGSCWGKTFIFQFKVYECGYRFSKCCLYQNVIDVPSCENTNFVFSILGVRGERSVAAECIVQCHAFRKTVITCCC